VFKVCPGKKPDWRRKTKRRKEKAKGLIVISIEDVVSSMFIRFASLCAFMCLPHIAIAAQSSCYELAETYYENKYCEIKQKSPRAALPAFGDFKKNAPRMQAMLLKRKAEAAGIDLQMPGAAKKNFSPKKSSSDTSVSVPVASSCELKQTLITCPDGQFVLTGNKRNSKISRTALQSDNRLTLNNYNGDLNDREEIIAFLTVQYTRYLEKMLALGLGGVTMSFTKFHTLFWEIENRGADFSKRFETMYEYLKKDKSAIGVSERASSIAGITIDECARLTRNMFTCDNNTTNSIYLKQ